MARCSECDAEITIPKDAMKGEILTCVECGSSFEIIAGEGGSLALKPAQSVGEDWGQ